MSGHRYVMIGAPVTTVRTPPLLERHLAARGVAAVVETRHVEAAELAPFVAEVSGDASVDGLLVTMPHKRAIVRHLPALEPSAAAVGSVNAVKRGAGGTLLGAQFDGTGLLNALDAARVPVSAARVWLKGVGGAGRSIAAALLERGCAHLLLDDPIGRSADGTLESMISRAAVPLAWADEAEPGARELLINATPLGMRPDDASAFPDDAVRACRCVADIVADPPDTRLARRARELGRTLVTGRDMVEGQVRAIADWLLAPL